MASLGIFSCALLGLLAALLVTAAFTDLRSRTIANGLNGAVALLAIPWWFSIGLGPWAMLLQVGIAAAVLALFALCFAIGMMGGGDAKLIAALALWLPLQQVMQLLLWTALAGGVVTLAAVVAHRRRRSAAPVEVPYGVAIAAAALLIVANDILTKSIA